MSFQGVISSSLTPVKGDSPQDLAGAWRLQPSPSWFPALLWLPSATGEPILRRAGLICAKENVFLVPSHPLALCHLPFPALSPTAKYHEVPLSSSLASTVYLVF